MKNQQKNDRIAVALLALLAMATIALMVAMYHSPY